MAKDIFKLSGKELIGKITDLINEGNVQRIIIKNGKGKEYLNIPVNVGILGVFFAPYLMALIAIASLASSYTIEVIRKEEKMTPKTDKEN